MSPYLTGTDYANLMLDYYTKIAADAKY